LGRKGIRGQLGHGFVFCDFTATSQAGQSQHQVHSSPGRWKKVTGESGETVAQWSKAAWDWMSWAEAPTPVGLAKSGVLLGARQ